MTMNHDELLVVLLFIAGALLLRAFLPFRANTPWGALDGLDSNYGNEGWFPLLAAGVVLIVGVLSLL